MSSILQRTRRRERGVSPVMHRAAARAVACLALAGCARTYGPPAGPPPQDTSPLPAYPVTRVDDVVDDYHGTAVADPYRWLEDLDDPRVRHWAAAQTALVTDVIRRDPRWNGVMARLEHHAAPWDALDALAAEDEGTRVAGMTFRHEEGVLTARTDAGDTRALFDVSTAGSDRAIARFHVAPDGRHVAIAVSTGASEWVSTHVVRTADGATFAVVDGMIFQNLVWAPDGSGFFYMHMIRPLPEERVSMRGASVRWHAVGSAHGNRVVHAVPEHDVELMLSISLAGGGRYLVVSEGTGADWSGMSQAISRLLVLDLRDPNAIDPSGTPRALLSTPDFGYRVIGSEGAVLHVLTDRDAPRKRIVAIDLRNPAPADWRTIIQEDARTIHRVARLNGRYVVTYLDDAAHQVRVFTPGGVPVRDVVLPPFTGIHSIEPGDHADELLLTTSSWLQPPTITRHDLATGAAEVVHASPPTLDTTAYETRQVWYRAKDGVRIPMFLVHRRGIATDRSHPVLLNAYGSSGNVFLPVWDEAVLAWVEAGGIYAWPSIRGGGEFGREWWLAAIRERMQTRIDDFVAAAEFLIAEGWTSPARIAALGTSYGGTLVSAALVQRPDLFGVVLPEVPMTDFLRQDRGRHRAQFGLPSRAQDFAWMRSWSPLHLVVTGTCYPATFIATALNDDRSPAWHSLKFAAALQSAQRSVAGCDRPVLLRAPATGGHAMNSGPDSFLENRADWLTFTMQRIGTRPLPPPQP